MIWYRYFQDEILVYLIRSFEMILSAYKALANVQPKRLFKACIIFLAYMSYASSCFIGQFI